MPPPGSIDYCAFIQIAQAQIVPGGVMTPPYDIPLREGKLAQYSILTVQLAIQKPTKSANRAAGMA